VGVGTRSPIGVSGVNVGLSSLCQMDDLNKPYMNTPRGGGCLVISPKDVMKFKTIELFLELSDFLLVCRHPRVTVVLLPHDLVDNNLRVTADVKPLDIELGGDVLAIDEGLILHHVVGHAEVQSNNVEESIALWGDQHNTSPSPIESERVIKVYTPVLLGHWGAGGGGVRWGCCVSVHSTMKSARA
jgi:hypothetical protein